LCETFEGELHRATAKLGFRQEGSKDMLKEIFNRVAYVPIDGEYMEAIDELRKLKSSFVVWILDSLEFRCNQSSRRKGGES